MFLRRRNYPAKYWYRGIGYNGHELLVHAGMRFTRLSRLPGWGEKYRQVFLSYVFPGSYFARRWSGLVGREMMMRRRAPFWFCSFAECNRSTTPLSRMRIISTSGGGDRGWEGGRRQKQLFRLVNDEARVINNYHCLCNTCSAAGGEGGTIP